MSLVMSGKAGPPSGPENFRPLYSAGLWLAVMLTPPSYLLLMMAWASTEVVGDHAAPPRGPEMDRLFRHGRLLYLGPRVKITQERRESQESTWAGSQK